jgi:molybdopterin synthase sulfur carrier subunit
LSEEIEKRIYIKVKIRVFASLKLITNKREIELELEEGANIAHSLEKLFSLYEKLRSEVFDDKKQKEWIQILKNGRNIKYLDGLDTELNNEDIISIFPPAAGG